MPLDRRLAVMRERDFRRFFLGYTTSLLGSAMASIALTFAILETGGGGTRLGWVMAARILPLVLMLLVGGVVGDRLGSRQAMLTADAVRCLTQLGLVAVLLDGEPHLWTLVGLVALWGAAEALFTPALGALVPHIVRPDALSDANALLEVTRSATSIAGPVLAGLLTAVVDASTVLALDAASYAVSMVVLLLLPRATRSTIATASFFGELAEGWAEFRSRTWLWVTTVHICLFNLFVWGPFLVLGPVIAERRLGGATSWGLVMALYGGGAVVGGLVMLGRLPRSAAACGHSGDPWLVVAVCRPRHWSVAAVGLRHRAGQPAPDQRCAALSTRPPHSVRFRRACSPAPTPTPPSGHSLSAPSGWPPPGRSPHSSAPRASWASGPCGRSRLSPQS